MKTAAVKAIPDGMNSLTAYLTCDDPHRRLRFDDHGRVSGDESIGA